MRTASLLWICLAICGCVLQASPQDRDKTAAEYRSDSLVTASPPTQTALPAQSSSPLPTAADPPQILTAAPAAGRAPAAQYHLNARIDYKTHTLEVNEQVTYANRHAEPLEHLVFVVESHQKPGAFQLKALRWGDNTTIDNFTLSKGELHIPLKQNLLPNEQITLHIAYTLELPEQHGTLGYTPRQINLADWYPFLPLYTPQSGWIIHPPHQVGEHLVYDIADYLVEIQLDNFPPQAVVAASAPSERIGNSLSFFVQDARNFTLSISEEYKKLSTTQNGILLSAYVFPEHEQAGKNALLYMSEALKVFSEIFQPYHHQSLSLVEWQNQDGMEYDGLFFLNWNYFEYAPEGARSGLASMVSHETAHQWWYALVGNDPAADPWLDEALCTYSEKLFYEMQYPELVSWWWDYRIHRYKPEGAVNRAIYEFTAYRPYVNAAYLRGALFLEDLRNAIGEETFFRLLSDYARQYQGKVAKPQDFFDRLAEAGPASLSELTNRYFISSP